MSKKPNANPFVSEINSIVEECNVTHLEAVLEYCQRKQVPVDSVAPLIRQLPKLKGKIRTNAEDLFLLARKK